jgi:hypothetical protein
MHPALYMISSSFGAVRGSGVVVLVVVTVGFSTAPNLVLRLDTAMELGLSRGQLRMDGRTDDGRWVVRDLDAL